MPSNELTELFPADLAKCIAERPILVLPLGTIEWHSHHLPVGLDGLVAEDLGRRIADACQAVRAPVSYWAVGGVPYPYTLNLPIAIIEPLLVALFEQFAAMGFRVIVAFTGHFGLEQTLALKRAAVTVMNRSSVTILPVTEYDLVTDVYTGDHAARGETSLLWASRPDLVRLSAVDPSTPLDGVIGDDPREKASQEWGVELRSLIVERTARSADRLLTQTSQLERRQFIEAISAAVRVLEVTSSRRQSQPKSTVPPVTTPSYISMCDAMRDGDYAAAKKFAEIKYSNLTD